MLRAAILIVVGALPLVIAPGWFLYFETTPKLGLLLAGLAVALWNAEQLTPGFRILWRSRFGRLFLQIAGIQAVWLFITSVLSQDAAVSFFGTGWRRLGTTEHGAILLFCAIVAAWLAEDVSRIRSLLRAICIGGIAVSAYGILQYFGVDPFLDSQSYRVAYDHLSIIRPPSTIGHSLYFAGFLVVLICLSLALSVIEASSRWRLVALFSMVTASTALLLTGTRSGLLGVIAAVAVGAWGARPKITQRRVALALAGSACCGALFWTPPAARLRDRLVQWSDDAKGGPRLLLWRDTFRMALDHPWLGTGSETFAGRFPKYQSEELARAYPDYYHESPHNILLDSLTSAGMPGVMLFLLLVGIGAASAVCSSLDRNLAAILAAGFAGIFVCQQFAPFVLSTALLFHLLLAILVAGAAVGGVCPSTLPANKLLSAATLAAAMFAVVLAARMMQLDWLWASLQRDIRSNNLAKAVERYRGIDRMFPPVSGPDVWYSRALNTACKDIRDEPLRRKAWEQSVQAAIRATRFSEDRQNAFYNLAVFHASEGLSRDAEEALRSAIALAPNWYKPHWLLAEVLLSQGHAMDADTEVKLGRRLAGAAHPEIEETGKRVDAALQSFRLK